MPCVCDGGICVATSCRDVTCHVYVMVLYVLLHLVEICPVYVMVLCVATSCRDMPCVCDGAICVATSCRDVKCPVYVIVIYVLLHLVEMSNALCM